MHNEQHYNFGNIYLLITIISSILIIIIFIIAFPETNDPNEATTAYWFYDFCFGICFGLLVTSQEFIFVELQPKEQSGKIRGQQLAIRTMIRAFETLFVGLQWDTSYDFFGIGKQYLYLLH